MYTADIVLLAHTAQIKLLGRILNHREVVTLLRGAALTQGTLKYFTAVDQGRFIWKATLRLNLI